MLRQNHPRVTTRAGGNKSDVTSQIEQILESVADPRDPADALVRAAVAAGGRDNATAVVVDVVGLVKDATYDSQRQLESLESKLGGRL